MILYGTNPIAWANDDDQSIGAHIPTEQILHEAGEVIGFDGIENGHRWPEDPQELKALLGRYGLRFISGWYSTELLTRSVADEIASVQGHLAKLKANDCKVCIVCECSNTVHGKPDVAVNDRPRLSPEEMAEFGAKIEEFAAYLASQGITLAYHHHMGTVVQTEAEIDRFMGVTSPAVGLLLDTGHATWGGGDPARIARHWKARIHHVHCKDIREAVMWRSNREDWSFLESVLAGVYTVPGDGLIDYVRVLRELQGYSGWIVVEAEQDPKVSPPLEMAKIGHEELVRVMAAAGYTVEA